MLGSEFPMSRIRIRMTKVQIELSQKKKIRIPQAKDLNLHEENAYRFKSKRKDSNPYGIGFESLDSSFK